MPLRIRLLTWHYAPEPIGIGPVASTWARTMRDRGHEVEVLAAYPHYPRREQPSPVRARTTVEDGIRVTRLPMLAGRGSAARRALQEITFFAAAAAHGLVARRRADVCVTVSPPLLSSFVAFGARRLGGPPVVLWLQDIVSEAAETTGLMRATAAVRGAKATERAAYRAADAIVVISGAFEQRLIEQGVESSKIWRIPNPATRPDLPRSASKRDWASDNPVILSMGNIGYSQGLGPLVSSLEISPDFPTQARLLVTGDGALADDVRARSRGGRTHLLGVVSDEELDGLLGRAVLALVSQRADIVEFNYPSKLMNFMAAGLPVLAAVNPGSEVARTVHEANAGWVVDSSHPDRFGSALAEALSDRAELERRGYAARRWAERHFDPAAIAERFEALLEPLSGRRGSQP